MASLDRPLAPLRGPFALAAAAGQAAARGRKRKAPDDTGVAAAPRAPAADPTDARPYCSARQP